MNEFQLVISLTTRKTKTIDSGTVEKRNKKRAKDKDIMTAVDDVSELVLQYLNINNDQSEEEEDSIEEAFQLDKSAIILNKLIINTLQNAINSNSYIKQIGERSEKSSLPFLYNQTIRRNSVDDDLCHEENILVTVNILL